MSKTIQRGAFAGFKQLQPGRIHLLCPACGLKRSNMPKDDELDPPSAALLLIHCPRCSAGGKVEGGEYFNKRAKPIDWHRWYMRRHA